MKTLLTSLFVGLWVVCGNAQNILVVDNTQSGLTGDHVYTDLASAVQAAQAGDIVHIMPSTKGYGSIEIDKPLSLIGTGFNPDTETPMYVSRIDRITLLEGISGLRIAGLVINIIGSSISPHNGVFINSCMIAYLKLTLSNSSISNCVFPYWGTKINGGTNVNVRNNVFITGLLTIDSAIVSNNIFLGSQERESEIYINNSFVSNNIFYKAIVGKGGVSQNTVFENNIVYSGLIDSEANLFSSSNQSTGSGNIFVNPLFENIPSDGIEPIMSGSADAANKSSRIIFADLNFHLKPESPGKNAGTDGTDIGIYGGSTPFVTTGSPIPIIQQLDVPTQVPVGQDLEVKIKARSF